MKGAVFVAFAELVVENHSLSEWHDVLDKVGDDGVFVGTANYPDERLLAILGKYCETYDVPVETALSIFGEYLFGFLHKGYPVFADSQPTFFDFIESIGSVIHLEVHKLDQWAKPPHIQVLSREGSDAHIEYRSERKLCHLAEGLLKGAADHFGIKIAIVHYQCMHDGFSECKFKVSACG